MLALLLLSTAQSATLDISGSCGNTVNIDVTGLTPGGAYAILSASDGGAAQLPAAGPCGGTQLELGADYTLRKTGTASVIGEVSLSFQAPAAICGVHVQVVDAATCTTSNAAVIPTGIDADGDGYDAAEDCDDDDASVYPGALEVCDRKANDCDADWTSDEGIVTWYDDDGSVTSLTQTFAQGTPLAPRRVRLGTLLPGSKSGSLLMCPGTYYASLEAGPGMGDVRVDGLDGSGQVSLRWTDSSPVRVVDFSNTGAAKLIGLTLSDVDGIGTRIAPQSVFDVELRDIQTDHPVEVSDAAVTAATGQLWSYALRTVGGLFDLTTVPDNTVTLHSLVSTQDGTSEGLTVRGAGAGSTVVAFEYFTTVTGGQGLIWDGVTVVADQLSITDSDQAGLTVTDSDVTITSFDLSQGAIGGTFTRSVASLSNGTVSNNVSGSGGGLSFHDNTTATLQGTAVFDNDLGSGSALYIDNSTVEMTDSLVYDNVASGSGGGAWMSPGSTLRCTKDVAVSAGFEGNAASAGGGVYMSVSADISRLYSTGCDWGILARSNQPEDVGIAGGPTYDYGNDASFVCTVSSASQVCL